MLPASNMKIVTLAAAAEKLGWDYRYETRVMTNGTVANGALDGDLIVVGSGDPSLMDGDPAARLFDEWAAELRTRGVQRILGRIVGDDNAFVDEGLGSGWMWDDLAGDDSAAVGALQFNENAVRVTVSPGPKAGDTAGVTVVPPTSVMVVRNVLTTSDAASAAHIDARRLPGSSELELRGSIPQGSAPVVRVVSVDNPTLFFVAALRNALIARGIDVRGAAVDIDDIHDTLPPAAGAPLVTLRSAPLSTLAIRLMKISQNLYAETFLTSLSATAPASATSGAETARTVLSPWGVGEGGLILRDGSGLTRYDFVTAEALVTILARVHQDERLRGPFQASLPIAGRDGTLTTRMKGTPAEGNVRAKTGSMTGVRTISGYVTTSDGEPLVFAILANNFETSADIVNKATDDILVRLAQFRR
jgi:D-alanyl-D-alanine carboxypeptidase/D-alanyl-D-alanine-endopeptidase (penicillin-binding protein 4)